VGEKAQVARPRRVVLDTNVAVSALVFQAGRLAWLREAWAAGRVVPLVSAETLAELVRVLAYPKFELSDEETKNVLAHYMEHAEAVRKTGAPPRVPECRDADDRKFLQLAYTAKADALVTGDDDLLSLARKSRVPILTPDAFRTELGA
jgi:uncharacterized protein